MPPKHKKRKNKQSTELASEAPSTRSAHQAIMECAVASDLASVVDPVDVVRAFEAGGLENVALTGPVSLVSQEPSLAKAAEAAAAALAASVPAFRSPVGRAPFGSLPRETLQVIFSMLDAVSLAR
jgi:hypothetical protein